MALGMAMLSCLHQTEITQQLQNGLSWTWTKPKSVISWLCVLVYDFRLNSGFLFGVVFLMEHCVVMVQMEKSMGISNLAILFT